VGVAVIDKFIKNFEEKEINLHSFLFAKSDNIIAQGFYHPVNEASLQRMFSVTKSFTGVAILLLVSEEKLRLTDEICRFYSEYVDDFTHEWILNMSVKDLLTMQTCHNKTTYKFDPMKNWVESFFKATPSRIPGQFFSYDTSASHVLADLVGRITGMSLLDYLRISGLKGCGFSDEAYIINDPFHNALGGSGLMATTADLYAFAKFICNFDGRLKQLIDEAISLQTTISTNDFHKQHVTGYGYHFWVLTNGFMAFGMGGQYIIIYPADELILIITADTQGYIGAEQFILDSLVKLHPVLICDNSTKSVEFRNLAIRALHDEIPPQQFRTIKYRCKSNSWDVVALEIDFLNNRIIFCFESHAQTLHFGRGENIPDTCAFHGYAICSSGAWLKDGTFLVCCHILDEVKGTLFLQFSFQDHEVFVFSKKIAEDCYEEFDKAFLVGCKC